MLGTKGGVASTADLKKIGFGKLSDTYELVAKELIEQKQLKSNAMVVLMGKDPIEVGRGIAAAAAKLCGPLSALEVHAMDHLYWMQTWARHQRDPERHPLTRGKMERFDRGGNAACYSFWHELMCAACVHLCVVFTAMYQKCAREGEVGPIVTLFTDDLNAWLADPNAKQTLNDGFNTMVFHEGRWMTANQKGAWPCYLEHRTAVIELKGMEDDVMVLLADDACDQKMLVLNEKVAAQELVVAATLERKEKHLARRKANGKYGRGEDMVTLKTGLVARGEDKVTLKTGLVARGEGLVARGEGLVARNLDKVSLKTDKKSCKTDKVSCKTDKVSCKTDKKSCKTDKRSRGEDMVTLKTDKRSVAAAHLLTLELDEMDDKKQKEVRVAVHER
jgi:hypothetical protein